MKQLIFFLVLLGSPLVGLADTEKEIFDNAKALLINRLNFVDGVASLTGIQKKNNRACFVDIKIEENKIQALACKEDPKEKNEEKKCAEFELVSNFKPKYNSRNKMYSKVNEKVSKFELTTIKEVPDLNAKATYKLSIEAKKDGLLVKVKQSGRAFIFLSDSKSVECFISNIYD